MSDAPNASRPFASSQQIWRAATAAMNQTIARTIARKIDPAALIPGDDLVILSVGAVHCEATGRCLDGNVSEPAQLEEMVRYFDEVQRATGQLPLIDWNHKAVGDSWGAGSIDEQVPLGAVIGLRVEGSDLIATPGWTQRGRRIIDEAQGTLYPSAAYRLDPIYDRASGKQVATAGLFAFAVTPTPATRVDKLGAIRTNAAPAATKEARRMTADDIKNAIGELPDEERAALLAGLTDGDAPESKQAEAPAVEARAADDEEEEGDGEEKVERSADAGLLALVKKQGAELRKLTEAKRLEARAAICGKVKPVLRQAAEAIFDAAPTPEAGTKSVEALLKSEMVDTSTISRSAGRDGGADEPPADEDGFAEYVARNLNQGETFEEGLTRIRAAFPDKYRAAVIQKGGRRG